MSAADQSQAVYREQLQALQRIRAKASGTLKLPQICVVGDQSSGKSSLLASCTGIAFPENAGICTRAPIVVECKCDTDLPSDEYKIQGSSGTYDLCSDLEDLKARITSTQDSALKKSLPLGLGHGTDLSGSDPPSSSEDQEELEPANEDGEGDTSTTKPTPISMDEIRVKVRGPKQMDIIVVDLPGIIHNGAGAHQTRGLIRRYCQPQQTLMLLVSEAKQDEESTEAIALAKKYDKDGSRTLRVLTKFDVFDSDKARERAQGWVEAGGSSSLGCHAVVCRSRGVDHNPDVEAGHLEGLPAGHSGVAALKARLPPLFAKLITKSLPELHAQITQKWQEAEEELRVVGDERVPRTMMVYILHRLVSDTKAFENELTPHMTAFQQAILATASSVTKEWTDAKFSANAFQLMHFQGNAQAMTCMDEIVDNWWRGPLDTLHEQVCSCTKRSLTLEAEFRKSLPDAFCRTVEDEWKVFCTKELFTRYKEELGAVLKKERGFASMNHGLDSAFEELNVLPQDLLLKIVKELPGVMGKQGWASLQAYLEGQRKAWIAQYQALELQDQQKYRIYNAVCALWKVESKTFVDDVLKATRDFVVKTRQKWLDHDLRNNSKVLEMAEEDEETALKRQDLKQQIARMKGCLQELESLRRGVTYRE